MHSSRFLEETSVIASKIDCDAIETMAQALVALRDRKGTLYLVGLGGSAANCSHAAADFRKLCDIRAFAPTDNMAEFSARANDDGFSSVFSGWLTAAGAGEGDALLVLSVGGGTDSVSIAITRALHYAQKHEMVILGIVGPNGGETAARADCVVKVAANEKHVTPHTEAFQAVIWHCLVSHPLLQMHPTKW